MGASTQQIAVENFAVRVCLSRPYLGAEPPFYGGGAALLLTPGQGQFVRLAADMFGYVFWDAVAEGNVAHVAVIGLAVALRILRTLRTL